MIGPEVGLSALLKLTGATQLELAQHLSVNRSTLASWLAGYSPMPDDVIVKIHKFVAARLRQRHPAVVHEASD